MYFFFCARIENWVQFLWYTPPPETIKTCLLEDEDEEVKKNALIALYNLIGREILDEVVESPIYSDKLKMEAVSMISEYEDNDE